MKKFFVVIALCLAGSAAFAQNVTLDAAIQATAREMGQALPSGSKVAVVNFGSPAEELSSYVIDELNDAIVNGKRITMVDRQRLDLILGELRFQDEDTGLVSEESAQEIALLGAQYIVSGSMELVGGSYRFRVQAIKMEGGVLSYSGSRNVVNDTTVQSIIDGRIWDFTPAEISRTRTLNFLWGAGSFTVQKDIFGGVIVATLDTAGLACLATGLIIAISPDSFANNNNQGGYDNGPTITKGYILAGAGVLLYATGCIFGYLRPPAYHRPGSTTAKGPMDPTAWNIALVSGERGDLGLDLSYRLSF
jgi:nucleoid DNA-binding protein